ncbi:MAG TPA: RNA polymerase sigma-54 factor, partial [Burkholderiaceae bacterium]|nr:RNA polymerase sigma-54 factor [Burkholderiaceae bacterium]
MKQSLQLRMSQHLALTPQLQQSIRLLQLSTLELNQELEQILADNPLLERTDDPIGACLHVSADGSLYVDQPPQMTVEPAVERTEREEPRELDPEPDDGNREYGADLVAEYGKPQRDDDDSPPQLGDGGMTLREHLLAQLVVEKLGLRERVLAAAMIESLDDDGYLHADEEEIASLLPDDMTLEPGEYEEALEIVQSLEPPGVGARTIAECLSLQLLSDLPVAREADTQVRACALRICRDHLQLLAQRDFAKLRKLLGADDDLLREAHALIRRLDPYPGSAFSQHESGYIVPDVIVRKIKGEWVAMLNRDVMPKLRINQMYAQILKSNRGASASSAPLPSMASTNPTASADGARGALSSHLQEARWLIKNVQQRFDTILRVAQAIVERQRAFF